MDSDEVQVDKLYGTGTFGTIYNLDKGGVFIEPEADPDDPKRVKDTAPEDRWRFDTLSPDREEVLHEVVAHIKTACI